MSFPGWSVSEFKESIETLLNDNEDLFIITSGGNKVFTSWGNFTNQLWSIAGLNQEETAINVDADDGRSYQSDIENTNIKFGAVGNDVSTGTQLGLSLIHI